MKQTLQEYRERYAGNYRDRTILTSAGSTLLGAFLGLGKLLLGVFSHSEWLIATAVFHLVLTAARGHLICKYHQTCQIHDLHKRYDEQFAVYQHEGIFLCLMGVCYLTVCARMYLHGEATTYHEYILYGVALVAFYKVGSGVYGLFVTNKMKNPLLSALKILSCADACVSIVITQCALLAMLESPSATTSSALMGGAFGLGFIITGVCMRLRRKVYPQMHELDIRDIIKKQPAPKISPPHRAPRRRTYKYFRKK